MFESYEIMKIDWLPQEIASKSFARKESFLLIIIEYCVHIWILWELLHLLNTWMDCTILSSCVLKERKETTSNSAAINN